MPTVFKPIEFFLWRPDGLKIFFSYCCRGVVVVAADEKIDGQPEFFIREKIYMLLIHIVEQAFSGSHDRSHPINLLIVFVELRRVRQTRHFSAFKIWIG